jgi:hypothetical protein
MRRVLLVVVAVLTVSCKVERRPVDADNPVAQVLILPDTVTIDPSGVWQFDVYGRTRAGDSVPVSVRWSASAGDITQGALFSADSSEDDVTISAALSGSSLRGSALVRKRKVVQVILSPSAMTLFPGATQQFSARGVRNNGDTIPLLVNYAATGGSVGPAGLYTAGTNPGTYRVIAVRRALADTAVVTIQSPPVTPVASVVVTPGAVTLRTGASAQLNATVFDSLDNSLIGRSVAWSSNAMEVATVSASGLVSAVSAGSATITASSEGKSGSSIITVSDTSTPPARVGRYAAVSGTSGGDGTAARPWDLATALAGASGRVRPGDTVWVRGGTYSGAFTSSVAGTQGLPVVVRAFPGERPIIDGAPSTQETFTINGSWSVFWGLEIMNSILTRDARRPQGIYVNRGSHVKLINFVVHDVGEGLYTESSADDVEIYGSIFYNQGWQTSIRSDGHGVYVKNSGPGSKLVRDNVFFNSYGLGIHGYTDAGDGFLRNIVIEGNVMFNAGTLSTYPSANLLLGGEAPVENGIVKDNFVYFSPAKGSTSVRLGYLSVANGALTATNNYIVGGATPLDLGNWSTATVSGNTIYGSGHILSFRDGSGTGYTWTGQRYYRDSTANAWAFGGSWSTLGSWRGATGLGAGDVATSQLPGQPVVFVRQNLYEVGRATVVVYNWSRQSAVTVDLAGMIPIGTRYEVRSVQNLFGAAITTGTFGGSITIPMSAVTPISPIGGSAVAPVRTGPDFDVFLVTPVP